MIAFNKWLAKYQKIEQLAVTSQYPLAPARCALAFNFPTPLAWTLGPHMHLRGKELILEISRSND